MEDEYKDKLKQVSAGEPELLSDSSFPKMQKDLEFMKDRFNFISIDYFRLDGLSLGESTSSNGSVC